MQKKRQKKQHKQLLITLVLILAASIVAYALITKNTPNPFHPQTLKAAIIDQLSLTYPNNTFWQTANTLFYNAGWRMYYYAGGALSDTVDFYRNLPQQGFKIIILRVHTALNPETGTLAIFTSEEWDDTKATTTYLTDILNDRLAKVAITENATPYFGLTPNFIKAMNGNFQNAIIIAMGCDTLTNTKMAQAFIEKGAKAYIGWTGPVSAPHTDTATQQLLTHLITEQKTINQAIQETINEVGEDPTYKSTLSYYPTEAANQKIP
jgi:hypothetical protein